MPDPASPPAPRERGSGDSGCRRMLRAVRDTLDIPAPATVAEEPAHYAVLAGRAALVRFALAPLLRDGEPDDAQYEHLAEVLTGEARRYPPAYRPHPLGT